MKNEKLAYVSIAAVLGSRNRFKPTTQAFSSTPSLGLITIGLFNNTVCTMLETSDASLVPSELTDFTLKIYFVPPFKLNTVALRPAILIVGIASFSVSEHAV